MLDILAQSVMKESKPSKFGRLMFYLIFLLWVASAVIEHQKRPRKSSWRFRDSHRRPLTVSGSKDFSDSEKKDIIWHQPYV